MNEFCERDPLKSLSLSGSLFSIELVSLVRAVSTRPVGFSSGEKLSLLLRVSANENRKALVLPLDVCMRFPAAIVKRFITTVEI